MNSPRCYSLVASTWLLLAAMPAQGPDTVRSSYGVSRVDGEICAGGPDYAARFDHRGVEFTPALGRAVDRPLPVRFTLDGVRRGANDVYARAADVAPVVDGEQVRYVHRPDFTELYDVRADGIEQSFVFAHKPAGTGDLVVRGTITTELPLAAASDDGVRYERAGLGGVTFGAVTGVDGNGATVRGSIRASGDHVEWVLPAAFVDHCAYPLVLDPLIGSSFTVGAANQLDAGPRVAFDASTSRYLVVWKFTTSGSTDEVRAQLVGPTGTLVGSLLVLSSTGLVYGSPAVANVNATNRFLVTWSVQTLPLPDIRIMMRSVSAASASMSSPVDVTGPSGGVFDLPVVGGDSRASGSGIDYACVVYRAALPTPRLEVRGVQVFAAADPVLVGSVQTVTSGNVAYPSITKHAGTAGRWITAWVHGSSSAPLQNVACRVIGAFGVPCSAERQVSTGVASSDVRNTSVATADGADFVVAWEDAVADRVRVRPFSFTGACPGLFSAGLQVLPVQMAGDQSSPAIEFCKDKYLLAWLHSAPGSTSVYVKGLSPGTCASCGAETVIELASPQNKPDLVSRWSGGDTASDEGLVVWTNGAIRARRCEAVGSDTVVSMGGSCGSTGFDNFATYNGDAVLGNLDFELVLASPTLPVLALVIGLSNVSLPCGPCTLVPALDIVAAGVTPNPLPIPCDLSYLGVDFYAQWLLLAPGGCPILPDFALSNALKFTIGE